MVLLFLFSFFVSANDTTARIDTGWLVFTNSKHISMDSEELYISLEDVKVTYQFTNHSDNDILTLVSFPLPKIFSEGNSKVHYNESKAPWNAVPNPFQFKVIVEGKEIPLGLELKINGFEDSTNRVVDKKFVIENIDPTAAIPQSNIVGDYYYTYYWHQLFPRGKTITVEHSYKTLSGTGFLDKSRNTYSIKIPTGGSYCFDKNFRKNFHALEKEINLTEKYQAKSKLEIFFHFNVSKSVGYILKTGSNGFGRFWVSSFILVPNPAAGMKNFKKVSAYLFLIKG